MADGKKRMDDIQVPERLDEVIGDCMARLKQEQRRRRGRLFAKITAAAASMAVFLSGGYAIGRYSVLAEIQSSIQEEAGIEEYGEETIYQAGEEPGYVNSVYLKESGSLTVTVSGVHHNGIAMYMSVSIRKEEPFNGTLYKEERLSGLRIESEGRAYGRSDIEEGYTVGSPDFIEGRFTDDCTFSGTVRVPVEGTGMADFDYDWEISGIFEAADAAEDTKGSSGSYYGEWAFHLSVPADKSQTEVKQAEKADIKGVKTDIKGMKTDIKGMKGIPGNSRAEVLSVTKTSYDISARLLLPEGEEKEDYRCLICDASGASLIGNGEYYLTESRDISTVYVFPCTREEYERYQEYYRSEAGKAKLRTETFAQYLSGKGLNSTVLHFQSEYISVFQNPGQEQ